MSLWVEGHCVRRLQWGERRRKDLPRTTRYLSLRRPSHLVDTDEDVRPFFACEPGYLLTSLLKVHWTYGARIRLRNIVRVESQLILPEGYRYVLRMVVDEANASPSLECRVQYITDGVMVPTEPNIMRVHPSIV